MNETRSALVVDDERDIRELLVLTLGRMGLRISTAANLAEARELLASNPYDLCITDMRLPDGPVMQVCDAQLLGQAVTNLLLNSMQALEGEGGRIMVALAELPDGTEISVEDDGPGFPAELRFRLTEPYVTTKGRRGAGLGLAIVQKIVEDQGAALHLEDGEAGGARVRIVFRCGETAVEPERGRPHDA